MLDPPFPSKTQDRLLLAGMSMCLLSEKSCSRIWLTQAGSDLHPVTTWEHVPWVLPGRPDTGSALGSGCYEAQSQSVPCSTEHPRLHRRLGDSEGCSFVSYSPGGPGPKGPQLARVSFSTHGRGRGSCMHELGDSRGSPFRTNQSRPSGSWLL